MRARRIDRYSRQAKKPLCDYAAIDFGNLHSFQKMLVK